MRLLEAILQANHRALAGDASAGLRPDDHQASLPLIALTCIDPRLNPLLPEVLGLPESKFIWLRNAGNIVTSPMSSTMRSLALACAIKGGKEIAIIGHSDCQACRTTMMQLLDRFQALGVDRRNLPEDLHGFFGLNASERQVVLRGVEFARESPLIGPAIPVHGIWLDTASGRLEWVVNGYEALASVTAPDLNPRPQSGVSEDAIGNLPSFAMGEMNFPSGAIGDEATPQFISEWGQASHEPAPPTPPVPPPVIPIPPPIPVKTTHWKPRQP